LGEKYRALAKGVLSDVFNPSNPTLLLLCPMLMELYYALAEDHHE
jgi:hypothetical protein